MEMKEEKCLLLWIAGKEFVLRHIQRFFPTLENPLARKEVFKMKGIAEA